MLAFRCKNFKCVKNINQCDRPYSTFSALQIDRTFDPLEDTRVNFAFDSNGFAIGRIQIPSGSIKFNANTSKTAMHTL